MSFMSMKPQSREELEIHSKGLLDLFDSHLKIIADRYLAFFKKRRSIEEDYITSLRKLHREANVVDASFDPRAEPITTRAAWDKIRDSLESEASTREAFTKSLEVDVIKPLVALKETGDQTRKRTEEKLRNSAAAYADHVENKISKLRQAYSKRNHPGDHAHSPGLQQVSNRKFGVKDLLFRHRREPEVDLDRAESEESVLEDDCRKAVRELNIIRSNRAENLEDGYNCLEDLVFRTTVKGVLVKYLDDVITASKAHHDLAVGTRPSVGKALNGTYDATLFRRAFSLSVPPLTLYRNFRSKGYSNSIFGVPLVDPTANQYDVPEIIGMCIAEVEKRGLGANKIYLLGSINGADVLQLRRRLESEKTFSFSSSDNIYTVAMLLELYLWDLPEPLLRLSLRDFRQYGQNKTRYIENDFSLLRSVIRELPPIHRETLGELSRHLNLVASYSDENGMTARALASQFRYAVFRGNTVVQGYVYLKDSLMEIFIENAHTLFAEPLSSPILSDSGARASTISYSSLFASSLFAGPLVTGPEGIESARSSSTILSSDSPIDFPMPPMLPPNFFPGPLLGLTPSQTFTDVRDSPEPEQVLPEQPYLQPPTIPPSPPDSLLSINTTHPAASSATSLQTGMRTFSSAV